jgi:hypothetical protein
MKVIAILLLCMLTLSAVARNVPNVPEFDYENGDVAATKEVLEVVGGILAGTFSYRLGIAQCFTSSKDIFTGFRTAIGHLRAETPSSVKTGIIEIGKTLLDIPDAIKTCKELGNIPIKLRALAVQFANPTLLVVNVGKNILWHSRTIFREVWAAIGHYDNKQWFSMGFNIGVIADVVFLRIEEKYTKLQNDGVDFLDGFAHGLNPIYYEDAKQCIDNVSVETFQRIENDLNRLDWKNPTRSIEAIKDIVEVFKSIITTCQTTSKDFEEFIQRFTNAFNPLTFVEAAIKIITNPTKFIKMIKDIQNDVKNKQWYNAGDVTGDFVGEVLKLRMSQVETMLKK